jgi:hypothetical protein
MSRLLMDEPALMQWVSGILLGVGLSVMVGGLAWVYWEWRQRGRNHGNGG